MLTFTLHAEPLLIPLGRTVDRRETWRLRAESAAAEELRMAYITQHAHTVAGRPAVYQPMRNGVDKGFNSCHASFRGGI